jgi:hypothetical protein
VQHGRFRVRGVIAGLVRLMGDDAGFDYLKPMH